MTSTLRRILSAGLLVILLAAGCGSSDTAEQASDETPEAEADQQETDSAAATVDETPTAPPSEADLAGGETDTPPQEPAVLLVNLARNMFNIDPDETSIDCMVAEAEATPGMAEALSSGAQIDDEGLQQLTYALNGCLDAIDLGAWATVAVGPTGTVLETAPECFGQRFDDPDRGDATFHTFAALTLQYRLDPDAVADVTEALVNCTPITSLSTLFANQHEAEASYTIEVDRDCLVMTLDAPGVSAAFWTMLVTGDGPPVTTIAAQLAECSAEFDADLAQELPADFVPWIGEGALAAVAPAARINAYSSPPPMTIDPGRSYEAVITTGGGEIRLRLFAETAPVTVNNFVNLARDGYFERTVFHRVLADFMAQAGDPSGTGGGSPGYQFADEIDDGPPLDRKGLVAMANAGPGTNGSQFFITAAPTEWLTGLHTVFGEVISGQEIADEIELRDPNAPTGRGQAIDSIVIIES